LRGALEMSFVFDGSASNTLELAYRSTPLRSIKTEILFPLRADILPEQLFDRILTPSGTKCGDCHPAEAKEDLPEFPAGAWESDVIEPLAFQNVTLGALQAENTSCDASTEPDRCSLLSALLNHGAVQAGEVGNPGL
jgi:hypothetical protein